MYRGYTFNKNIFLWNFWGSKIHREGIERIEVYKIAFYENIRGIIYMRIKKCHEWPENSCESRVRRANAGTHQTAAYKRLENVEDV